MRAGWFGILFVAFAVLAGCNQGDEVLPEEKMTHENGLVIAGPAGFSVRKTVDGFEFIETGDVRSPRTISAGLSGERPAVTFENTEQGDGVETGFAVEALGAGSGGTEYKLTAVKPAGTRWIVVTAVEQSETSRPDFAVPRAMISGASAN